MYISHCMSPIASRPGVSIDDSSDAARGQLHVRTWVYPKFIFGYDDRLEIWSHDHGTNLGCIHACSLVIDQTKLHINGSEWILFLFVFSWIGFWNTVSSTYNIVFFFFFFFQTILEENGENGFWRQTLQGITQQCESHTQYSSICLRVWLISQRHSWTEWRFFKTRIFRYSSTYSHIV